MKYAGIFVIGVVTTLWALPEGRLNGADLSTLGSIVMGVLAAGVVAEVWLEMKRP